MNIRYFQQVKDSLAFSATIYAITLSFVVVSENRQGFYTIN